MLNWNHSFERLSKKVICICDKKNNTWEVDYLDRHVQHSGCGKINKKFVTCDRKV